MIKELINPINNLGYTYNTHYKKTTKNTFKLHLNNCLTASVSVVLIEKNPTNAKLKGRIGGRI